MNNLKDIVSGAGWLLIGTGFSKVFSLIATYFLVRVLFAEGYGKLGIILSTVGLFASIAGVGLSAAATKYIAAYKEIDKKKTGNILIICEALVISTSLIFSIAFFCLAPYISRYMYNDESLIVLLRLGSLYMLFLTMNTAQIGTLTGFQEFRSIATNNFISSIIFYPLIILLGYEYKIIGVLFGYIFMNVVLYTLNLFSISRACKKYDILIRFSFNGIKQEFEIIKAFIIPNAISSFIAMPVIWLCDTMLANSSGGYSEVAIYNAANQWKAFILFIPQNIGIVFLPLLSSLFMKNNIKEYKSMFNVNITVNFLISLVITIPLMIFSNKIMSGFGEEFSGKSFVFIITMTTSVMMVLNDVIGRTLVSQGKMWLGLLFNMAWAFALILSAYILVVKYDYGAIGLTTAYLIAYSLHSIWQYVFVRKKMNIV